MAAAAPAPTIGKAQQQQRQHLDDDTEMMTKKTSSPTEPAGTASATKRRGRVGIALLLVGVAGLLAVAHYYDAVAMGGDGSKISPAVSVRFDDIDGKAEGRTTTVSTSREEVRRLGEVLEASPTHRSTLGTGSQFCFVSDGICEPLGGAGRVTVANLSFAGETVSAMVQLGEEEEFETIEGVCGAGAAAGSPDGEERCAITKGPAKLMQMLQRSPRAPGLTPPEEKEEWEEDEEETPPEEEEDDEEDEEESSAGLLAAVADPEKPAKPRGLWGWGRRRRRRRRRRRAACGNNCQADLHNIHTSKGCWGRCSRCGSLGDITPCSWTGQGPLGMCFEGTCEKPACFPGSATVRLQDGSRKPLAALRAGRDMIQTIDAAGNTQYERYLVDLHGRNEEAWFPFLRISHEAGGALEVSANHLLFVPRPTGAGGGQMAVRAAVLRPGDRLLLVAEEDAGGTGDDAPRARPVSITAVQEVLRRGAFAPLTLSGRVVVDEVAASSYAIPWPESVVREAELKHPILRRMFEEAHAIGHAVTLPLRWGAAAWAALVQSAPLEIREWLDWPDKRSQEKGGLEEVHWYAAGSKKFFEDAILSRAFGKEKWASAMNQQCP